MDARLSSRGADNTYKDGNPAREVSTNVSPLKSTGETLQKAKEDLYSVDVAENGPEMAKLTSGHTIQSS